MYFCQQEGGVEDAGGGRGGGGRGEGGNPSIAFLTTLLSRCTRIHRLLKQSCIMCFLREQVRNGVIYGVISLLGCVCLFWLCVWLRLTRVYFKAAEFIFISVFCHRLDWRELSSGLPSLFKVPAYKIWLPLMARECNTLSCFFSWLCTRPQSHQTLNCNQCDPPATRTF